MTASPRDAHPQRHVAEAEAAIRERYGDEVAEYYHRFRADLAARCQRGAYAVSTPPPPDHAAAIEILEQEAARAEASGSTITSRALRRAIEMLQRAEGAQS